MLFDSKKLVQAEANIQALKTLWVYLNIALPAPCEILYFNGYNL